MWCGGCVNQRIESDNPTPSNPRIEKRAFGVLSSGEGVDEYTLTSGSGVTVSILTWGGIIRTILTPDRTGAIADIALGYDSLPPYEARHPYFGSIAGRSANRIAKGKFSLDGSEYKLATNNGPNHLHGGINGFDRKNWRTETSSTSDSVTLLLSTLSPDGEEGYPGEVRASVRYTLSRENTLRIDYSARASKATPLNLTNHTYFNLAGHDYGTIEDHQLIIKANSYLPVDSTLIPTGARQPVASSPFDFREPRAIGSRLSEVGIGYDHNFVLDEGSKDARSAAIAWDPVSGRALEVLTTQPGIQFYSGNYLNERRTGKGGASYPRHSGFCLETQGFPDAINQPSFPSCVLRPNEEYKEMAIFRFFTR
jgi:aldose 1-epimerase